MWPSVRSLGHWGHDLAKNCVLFLVPMFCSGVILYCYVLVLCAHHRSKVIDLAVYGLQTSKLGDFLFINWWSQVFVIVTES